MRGVSAVVSLFVLLCAAWRSEAHVHHGAHVSRHRGLSLHRQEPGQSPAAANATLSTTGPATTTTLDVSTTVATTTTTPLASTTTPTAVAETTSVVLNSNATRSASTTNPAQLASTTKAAPVASTTNAGAVNSLENADLDDEDSEDFEEGLPGLNDLEEEEDENDQELNEDEDKDEKDGIISTSTKAAPSTTTAAVTTLPTSTTSPPTVATTIRAAAVTSTTGAAADEEEEENKEQVSEDVEEEEGNLEEEEEQDQEDKAEEKEEAKKRIAGPSTTAASPRNVIRRIKTTTAGPAKRGTVTVPGKGGTVTVPGCVTRKDPRVKAWFVATAVEGSQCVFGVDHRDEGSHCVPDEEYGSHGWCYTSADASSWGSCDSGCPLFGSEKKLADKVDEVENKIDEMGRLLRDLAAGLNKKLPGANPLRKPQASARPAWDASTRYDFFTSAEKTQDANATSVAEDLAPDPAHPDADEFMSPWEEEQQANATQVAEDLSPTLLQVADGSAAGAGPVPAASLRGERGDIFNVAAPPVPEVVTGFMLMQLDSERGSVVVADEDECPASSIEA